ncbi:dihydroorotase [Algicella marina]|uniref:Dihydroorotase n=1 Tax=Algicella marina TaxID=2683284 RepID=A0A6P1T086_9RHOB|nr:dihydroorotase [Algicella marina]QHQ35270.1 dihydroorotase [Algicella marina]
MSKPFLDRLIIRKPDDMHLHLRDGAMLKAVVPVSAASFSRAIVMPNLVPPVVTAVDAERYRERIMGAVGEGQGFEPLMTLYLTEDTDPKDVARAAASGQIAAVKLYPAGATTNSQSGVRDLDKVMPVLERLAEIGLPLCIHGEVTDKAVDIFDREKVFLETVLSPLVARLPNLRVVLEHLTTSEGVSFVRERQKNLAATITVHHLMINRNHMLVGGIRPHYYCLPILKRDTHQKALVEAATSGDDRFFLGTDSAPHLATDKESACGCAGCFTAGNAMPCLAQLFEDEGALDRLEGFTSEFGARYYGLALNNEKLTLLRSPQPVTQTLVYETMNGQVAGFDPQRDIFWKLEDTSEA